MRRRNRGSPRLVRQHLQMAEMRDIEARLGECHSIYLNDLAIAWTLPLAPIIVEELMTIRTRLDREDRMSTIVVEQHARNFLAVSGKIRRPPSAKPSSHLSAGLVAPAFT